MDYYRILNDTEGERQMWTCDGNELDSALIHFLGLLRSDRKVSLTYVGEEYEEE